MHHPPVRAQQTDIVNVDILPAAELARQDFAIANQRRPPHGLEGRKQTLCADALPGFGGVEAFFGARSRQPALGQRRRRTDGNIRARTVIGWPIEARAIVARAIETRAVKARTVETRPAKAATEAAAETKSLRPSRRGSAGRQAAQQREQEERLVSDHARQ